MKMGRLEYEFEVRRLATSSEHLGFLHEGIIESINDDLEAFDDLKKKNVRFMKKSVHIKRVLNWKILKTESGYQARFVLAK